MALDHILHYDLPQEILCLIFSNYLSVDDVCRFDSAISNHKKRPLFQLCIGSDACIWRGDKKKSVNSKGISWLNAKNIKIKHLKCGRVDDEMALQIAGFGIHVQYLDFEDINDRNLIMIVEGCPNVRDLALSRCWQITDTSAIKVVECYRDIESLNISRCPSITDDGLIAIAEHCHLLKEMYQAIVA
jgi:hypothetical protein